MTDEELADLQRQLKEALAVAATWEAQLHRSAISLGELVGENRHIQTQLNEARNENAKLKDENAALKVGEVGELLAKAQKDAGQWREIFERVSVAFREYRLEVESGEFYKIQRKVIDALYDEREAARQEVAALKAVNTEEEQA